LLGARVARILDEDTPAVSGVRTLRVAAVLALAGTAIAAPAVRLGSRAEAGTLAGTPAPTDLAGLGYADTQSAGTGTRTNTGTNTGTSAVARAANALNGAAHRELAALAEPLDAAVDELETELAALKSASAGRALDPALAERVRAMEQRASEVRSRAKRIRALLMGAASGGVEAPQGERRRAAAPSTPTRAR